MTDTEVLSLILEDVREIKEDIHALKNTTVKQELSLAEHMLRTKLNEEQIAMHNAQMLPLQKQAAALSATTKIMIPVVTALATVVAHGVMKLLHL